MVRRWPRLKPALSLPKGQAWTRPMIYDQASTNLDKFSGILDESICFFGGQTLEGSTTGGLTTCRSPQKG